MLVRSAPAPLTSTPNPRCTATQALMAASSIERWRSSQDAERARHASAQSGRGSVDAGVIGEPSSGPAVTGATASRAQSRIAPGPSRTRLGGGRRAAAPAAPVASAEVGGGGPRRGAIGDPSPWRNAPRAFSGGRALPVHTGQSGSDKSRPDGGPWALSRTAHGVPCWVAMDRQEWFTPTEPAEFLRVTRSTIYRWGREGWLEGHVLPSGVGHRFSRSDLDGLLRAIRIALGTSRETE